MTLLLSSLSLLRTVRFHHPLLITYHSQRHYHQYLLFFRLDKTCKIQAPHHFQRHHQPHHNHPTHQAYHRPHFHLHSLYLSPNFSHRILYHSKSIRSMTCTPLPNQTKALTRCLFFNSTANHSQNIYMNITTF